MDSCVCIDSEWPPQKQLLKYQHMADVPIAIAYFFIFFELIYFVQIPACFPYRWMLIKLGGFIALCGATHFLNFWSVALHSKTLLMVMAIAKMSAAVISCVTAVFFVHIIPHLLRIRKQELLQRTKADELDREIDLIIKQEETGRHVRMLTHEIRSTLDRQTILTTTLVELSRILELEECTLWMPSRRGLHLQLSHALNNLMPVGSTVHIGLPIVNEVFSSAKAIRIPYTCPLAGIKCPAGKLSPQEVVAVRVPLLNLPNFQINNWLGVSTKSFALMVLFLPSNSIRTWRDHELELVEVVTDQVAVALSHAAILEESIRARDHLIAQNVDLNLASQEAEIAVRARNDFLDVMNHEMRTPMHAVIALSSLLLETELTPEQRVMMETILKSGNLLATLINDVLELSKLDEGSLELDIQRFSLPGLFKEVVALIKPIAAVKRLSVSLNLALDLPVHAAGDEKRLMQIMLNIVGNAIKFTEEGNIAIEVSALRQEYIRDWDLPGLYPDVSNGHFLLQVQVKDTGRGVMAKDIPSLFTKFAKSSISSRQPHNGSGLGLAICKRFVNLMGGNIWVESEGLGKGTTVTFTVRLGTCNNPNKDSTQLAAAHTERTNQRNGGVLQYQQFGREDDGIYLSVSRHHRRRGY